MDDEVEEAKVYHSVARLHDRWSLLAFATCAVHDILHTATQIFDTASDMALEHARQKVYDRKFKEIVK